MNPLATYLAISSAPQRTWTLSHEGLAPSWALLLFVMLAVASVMGYLRCAPNVTTLQRTVMTALRISAAAILSGLLTKPVIQFTDFQPVKQPIAVMVDASSSMAFVDRRESPIDIHRAAIATGLVSPESDPGNPIPSQLLDQVHNLSRQDMVRRIRDHPKFNLWSRLAMLADLQVYQFGASAQQVGTAITKEPSNTSAAHVDFPDVKSDQPTTAIGESLRQVLQEPRSQPLGGILLITDGGNNSGSSPIEAAQIAKEQHVPLFIYGVGVTSPPDIEVKEVTAQRLAFIGERLEVRAHVVSRNIADKPTTVTLKADGQVVDHLDVSIGGYREQDITLHLLPNKAGEVKLEVSVPVRDEEVGKENNTASTTVRITDSKFNVLLIEREPRWDFRYLLDYLQRDPRLDVKCVMIDGEPGLDRLSNSPFLPSIPNTREALFKFQVLILGDVNPSDLGAERMQMIAEWVEAGGGMIFLAGASYNPSAYAGTALEPLLPVVAPSAGPATWKSPREAEPFPLELTPQGRRSAYLEMDSDPEANMKIWQNFPGVHWVAPVTRAKPGAEILLVDPRPSSAGRYGNLPVFAMHGYGAGKCVYFGTDETYRWRSKTGEKYYSILWGQIMQTLALQLLDNASSMTQLKTDRKQYLVGEKVVIAGNVFSADFSPLIVPGIEGMLTILKLPGDPAPKTKPLNLLAVEKNSFRGGFTPTEAGSYTFHTLRDPAGLLKFDVVDNNLERAQTALDDRLLQGMATAAGGHFLREEDLHLLPDWISSTSTRVASYRKVDLYASPWILAGLLAILFSEWLMRRLTRLK